MFLEALVFDRGIRLDSYRWSARHLFLSLGLNLMLYLRMSMEQPAHGERKSNYSWEKTWSFRTIFHVHCSWHDYSGGMPFLLRCDWWRCNLDIEHNKTWRTCIEKYAEASLSDDCIASISWSINRMRGRRDRCICTNWWLIGLKSVLPIHLV